MLNSPTFKPLMASFLMILGILLPGCQTPASPRQDADSDMSAPADSLNVEDNEKSQWVDSVMSAMTLEQLAGQLIMPAVYSDNSRLAIRSVVAYVADAHVGGVVLLKGIPQAAKAISDTLTALSAAPPFIAIDAEWGLAMRLKDTPLFPKNGKISPAVEDSILYAYGREVARECREVGINMVLGPVLDVLPKGKEKRGATFIGSRSFGSDPDRVARLGVAYAIGLEDGGVISVAKHFPGHGSADADSHKALPVIHKDVGQLEKQDLLPFARYADEQLSAVMVGHLYVPALDSEKIPVSVSKRILDDLLRKKMNFNGLIITDAMNMTGADGFSGVDAIMAGADIVLAPADTRREVALLIDAVRSGRLPISQLRLRVRRVLDFKYDICNKSVETGIDKSKFIQSELAK